MYSNGSKASRKIGAALFSKGNLLSIGFNQWGVTHPASDNGVDFTRNLHAEHKAVLKRRHYDNNNLVLYTYRETCDGMPACSKPCNNCMEIISEAGIKKVRYIDNNGQMIEMNTYST
jgi:deoxycytidylate deaminase